MKINLFGNKKVAFLVIFLLLAIELIFSLVFATHGTGKGWLSLPSVISHPKSTLNAGENLLINRVEQILPRYYINADSGQYILVANDFPKYYLKGAEVILDRPLYSFLIAVVAFFPKMIFDSFAVFFASAILLNFILGLASAILLYLLCEKFLNQKAAFLSSLLLIFSPFFHVWLVQPMPEIFTVFIIILTIFFLVSYVKKPSFKKLVIFSLIIGIFLLGKMFFALSIFVLLLAIYFKRYKEGAIFFLAHLLPLALWYLFVTKILHLPYFINEADYGVGVWILEAFHSPWHKTLNIIFSFLPQVFYIIIYGFLFLPVVFAILGLKNISFRYGRIFCLFFVLSFLILIFVMNLYAIRYGFLIYPIVYPLAALGIIKSADWLAKYKTWFAPIFYAVALLTIIVISNSDICNIFYYG
jgi:4-amino-4-deoxy-L-arabinose transferase-like glycosyltransferase